jgi:regulation of enolase protein 1 (concanavalin A-like superfamily)/plastocyanin
MVDGSLFMVRARSALVFLGLVLACLWAALAPSPAHAQDEDPRVLLYTGTTGFRHAGAINDGRPVVQNALEAIGYTVTWEDCSGNGGGTNNCDNANKNPRIFTTENLSQYDAILLLNASSGPPGPLWSDPQRAAIISYVQNGGGIAGVHNATDMGTGQTTWDWWDANNANSAVGSTMAGHAATDINNVAQVQVQDHNHLSTAELPDTYGFGDEHYNFRRNVRGDHHVLATLDERTYAPGGNGMGQDHPITWCRLYDGDNVNDGTGTLKSYNDGRVWTTGMGHFGASYTENGGNNNLIKQIVGGVRWVAGEGRKSDCSGTVWSSFTRTVLVPDASAPIGIDVAKDGKVYWSEIGTVGFEGQGQIMMHDPSGAAGNKTTVATIPTRADHGNSEDGVLGMSLEPGFDPADPDKRDLFVYYSPRPGAGDSWPTTGNAQTVGYNQVSRFTVNEAGTAVVPGSERVILRVPKAKIAGSPSGFPGGPTDSGPGHVGGAGLDFDSEGNLYLGVGDDVSPNAGPHNRYPPMDYRAAERWDARKTSANSADLRGKIVRIKPLDVIGTGTAPGVGQTYDIPAGNMFPVGTANARPEIYAMGFRQPFTIHTDPDNPGTVTVGEFCHDNNTNQADRAPAGVCEWNLVKGPGFHGWPFCMGDNSTLNTSFRWNYAGNASTGSQYNCSQASLPSDINWAPDGQTAAAPTNQGLENIPGPAVPATIWKKYAGATGGQSTADFGDLSAGGMQPVTGPVYRYDEETAGQGAFPPYYDGSWFINNRGANEGFWKEVRLREDNNNMLHVHDWLPYNAAGNDNGSLNGLVIGTQFGPDGALYMSRFPVGCCRNSGDINNPVQIVKIEFNVADQCDADTQPPNASHELTGQRFPGEPDTFVNSASLRLSATDVGCAGTDTIEYRLAGETEWQEYSGPVTFDEAGEYSVEYRATDRMENVSTVRTANFTVVEIVDEEAPTVTGALTGTQDQREFYVGSATLTLAADDGPTGSGVQRIEYRVNGGDWEVYDEPVTFADPAAYEVDYRAVDNVENTSEAQTRSFRLLSGAGCVTQLGDEFGGSALAGRWSFSHPSTAARPPSVSGGALQLPLGAYSVDLTRPGPIGLVGQPLPEGDFELTVKITAPGLDADNGGEGSKYAQAGLKIYQDDNHWIKITQTRNADGGPAGSANTYFETSYESSGSNRTLGARTGMAAPAVNLPTWWMRVVRSGSTVSSAYSLSDPEGAGGATWVALPITPAADLDTIMPAAAGPRYIGVYGGNGSITASYDYVRFSPDEAECEEEPPVTTAALDPATPGPGGTYGSAVTVNLAAADAEAGVDFTEYRVDGGDWQTAGNAAGEDPFHTAVAVTGNGAHTVEYRSIDNAANVEETQSVAFSIELAECRYSDEFDGSALNAARWPSVRTDPAHPITVGGGSATLPILNEIDGAATGPIAFVSQPLPSGTSWVAEAKVTVNHQSSWQQAGIMLWQSDTNFVKVVFSRNSNNGSRYFEITADNPPNNTRNIGQSNGVPTTFPTTGYVRLIRDGNNLTGAYSEDGTNWTSITGNNSTKPVNVNPPREGEGVQIGVYAGSDIDSNYESTAAFDYFRFTPDDCPEPDQTAPETSALLNGSAPVATYEGPVNVTLSATDEPADGDPFLGSAARTFSGALEEHIVRASGTAWDPTEVDAVLGDVVTWNFDDPSFAHDVWVIAPDEAPGSAGTKVSPGDSVPPGGPPVSFTPDDDGTWTYVCKLHSFVSGGQWSGMVGTIDVTDTGGPGPVPEVSGVDYTEYQVDGGAWVRSDNDADEDPFVTEFSVSGEGDHTVQYRSVDGAGNEEAAKSVSFAIEPDTTEPDTTAPETSVQLNGAAPVASYTGAVTATFSATDPGDDASGVERTEYKIDSVASWTPYDPANPPQVSGAGVHTIQYRSVDGAGNEEAPREVSFTITTVSGGGGSTPPPDGGSTPPPPSGGGPVAPAASPSADLRGLPRRVSGRRLAGGLRVAGACVAVARGTARLTASAPNARRLKLGKRAATLGRATLRCANGRFSATLRPNRKAGRALRRLRGQATLKVVLRMGSATDTATVKVRGRR